MSKGVFEVEGSKSPKITKNGMCTCKLHITKSSMELDNRRFVLIQTRLPDEMLLKVLGFWRATTSTGVPL